MYMSNCFTMKKLISLLVLLCAVLSSWGNGAAAQPSGDNSAVENGQKPVITAINITNIDRHDEAYAFDVYYEVFCTGADKLIVSVEEEYGARMPMWVFYEPFRVSGVAPNIASLHGAWIDFIAENEYGETVKTVEFAPGGILVPTDPIISSVQQLHDTDAEICRMEVFGINGTHVATLQEPAQLSELRAGVYIIKYYDRGNRCVKISKTLIR